MTGRLQGKRAIVTGAAGGIGRAAVRAFAAEGIARIGLLDLPGPALEALVSELGPAAVALPCDLSDDAGVARALEEWDEHSTGLDVIYACAGVQLHGHDARVGELDPEIWDRTMAANARGVFTVLHHGVPRMVASGGGSVIVCGSPTAMTMSGAGYSAYSASKAAAMALTRVVAADYAADGVRANIIVPGTTATGLIASLLEDPAVHAELVAGAPLGRIGTPEDLTGIAVFLASDESSYATGAVFAVDGGLTNR